MKLVGRQFPVKKRIKKLMGFASNRKKLLSHLRRSKKIIHRNVMHEIEYICIHMNVIYLSHFSMTHNFYSHFLHLSTMMN